MKARYGEQMNYARNFKIFIYAIVYFGFISDKHTVENSGVSPGDISLWDLFNMITNLIYKLRNFIRKSDLEVILFFENQHP